MLKRQTIPSAMNRCLFILVLTSFSLKIAAADTPVANNTMALECRTQLEKIHAAIQEYRTENKKLPGYFGDLVPKFISDNSVFLCPGREERGS